jgi:hypothetical protein
MTNIKYNGVLDNRSGKMRPLPAKAYRIWLGQRDRCNSVNHNGFNNYGKKGINTEYSSRDFVSWCLSQKNFNINSSIGRIDHNKNYSLSNIEVTTVSENTKERNSRHGNPTPPIKIICIDTNSDEIIFFDSIRDAHAKTGSNRRNIKNQLDCKFSRIIGRYVFFRDNK